MAHGARPGSCELRPLIGWPIAALARHWLRGLIRGRANLNIEGDVRASDRDLVRLLPWIIEAVSQDRRPEPWRRRPRQGEAEAMSPRMPGVCLAG